MADGRAVTGWKWTKDGVAMDPYERLSKEHAAALEADAADVARFLAPSFTQNVSRR
jgi:hypothetical protein